MHRSIGISASFNKTSIKERCSSLNNSGGRS
jgi:hypothetical protein